MNLQLGCGSESRFDAFVGAIASIMRHVGRARSLHAYCVGLVMPGERKSVEPMAALTAPARVAAQHQSLLHFVGQSEWSDDKVMAKIREMVLPVIEQREPIQVWIIDDTGIPKQGKHSVGVASQYCGQLGRQGNCQVAVSLSLANHYASLPVAHRLYLPKSWAEDKARRHKAGVPPKIKFKSKQQIALDHIRWACEVGLPKGVLLMDADYGRDGRLRKTLTTLGLQYVAGIQPTTLVWKPGTGPRPGYKRPREGQGRRGRPNVVDVKEVALALPATAWQTIEWREGSAEVLSSRFARVRVRLANRHAPLKGHAEEWLLIEWPEGEKEPTKYWLSTLSEDIAFRELVDFAKLRWRIERDYEELKQELGLGHYEGRGWRGFHHPATLCIAAYGFLISERETIPPSGGSATRHFAQPGLPSCYRPRGSAAQARTTHAQLNCYDAQTLDPRSGQTAPAMSLLCRSNPKRLSAKTVVTQ
jgi:SRSO17 transposase